MEFVRLLTLLAAIGSGLMAGVFFAFSSFVMPALRRLPDEDGHRAMNAINAAAPSPVFGGVLVLTALLQLAAVIAAALAPGDDGAWLRIAGGLAGLAAGVLTAGFHVPRNERLARVEPGTAEAPPAWRGFLAQWVPGNHVRTGTSLAGAVLLTLGWCAGG